VIVVFGCQGQLGRALEAAIGEDSEHVFLTRDSQNYCGDITNTAGIAETIMDLRPEIIINAAAYTAVNKAESEPGAAHAANSATPGLIAQIAAKIGSLFVHYSTDYVFEGSGEVPWKETDACVPLSVYGKSKLAGEQAILSSGAKHFILRTSWVYSSHGHNFLKTILQLAEECEELLVVNDQWGAPTHVDYLTAVTLDLIELATAGFGSETVIVPDWGIYHCVPAGETNWFEYARLVINTAKSLGHAKACKKIVPIASTDYLTAAQRPLNSRLDTSKLQMMLGRKPENWQEAVSSTVHELLCKLAKNDRCE
jgi:dTDP-4-dehydrorhamnose reductase